MANIDNKAIQLQGKESEGWPMPMCEHTSHYHIYTHPHTHKSLSSLRQYCKLCHNSLLRSDTVIIVALVYWSEPTDQVFTVSTKHLLELLKLCAEKEKTVYAASPRPSISFPRILMRKWHILVKKERKREEGEKKEGVRDAGFRGMRAGD